MRANVDRLRHRRWYRHRGAALLAFCVAILVFDQAFASEKIFWKSAEVLKSFFPDSAEVVGRKIQLSTSDRARIGNAVGAKVKSKYTIFTAQSGTRIDGYALIDHEKGLILPLTLAVKLSRAGRVERVEIMVLREPRGLEVADAGYLKQFVGKGPTSSFDVTVPTARTAMGVSATKANSAAMVRAVRRTVFLINELAITR